MHIEEHQKFRLNKNIISTILEGEAILLDTERGYYYSLNEVGKSVFDFMGSEKKRFKDMLNCILEEYDVDEKMAREDLEALIEELLDEKLLVQVRQE